MSLQKNTKINNETSAYLTPGIPLWITGTTKIKNIYRRRKGKALKVGDFVVAVVHFKRPGNAHVCEFDSTETQKKGWRKRF